MDASLYDGPITVLEEKLAGLKLLQGRIDKRVGWLHDYLERAMHAIGAKEVQAGPHRLFMRTAGGKVRMEWLGQPGDIPPEWRKPPAPEPAPEFDRKRYEEWRAWYDGSSVAGVDKAKRLPDRADELIELEALFIKKHERKTSLQITP
jgi:hypothetical protein